MNGAIPPGRQLSAAALLAALVAFATLAAQGGCASRDASSRNPWNLDTWSFQNREDPPQVFPVTSPVSIDVESLGGDVIVETDEDLTEATVTITRQATHGFGRIDEAKASLDQIGTSVSLVPGEMGPVLAIRTWTTHAEPHFQRTHVHVVLPEAD